MQRLPTWLVNGAATVGGIGYLGPMPGTNGSVVGVLFFWLLLYGSPVAVQVGVMALLVLLAWFFCDEAEYRMNARDPGKIVLDEFASIPLVYLGIPPALEGQALAFVLVTGFVLFRFFDIAKPLGIRRLQFLPGGLGVLMDDVAAALAACAVLHIVFYLVQQTGIIHP